MMEPGGGRSPAAPDSGAPRKERADEEPPPILGSWKRLYALVLLNLAALILLFWLFTRWFK